MRFETTTSRVLEGSVENALELYEHTVLFSDLPDDTPDVAVVLRLSKESGQVTVRAVSRVSIQAVDSRSLRSRDVEHVSKLLPNLFQLAEGSIETDVSPRKKNVPLLKGIRLDTESKKRASVVSPTRGAKDEILSAALIYLGAVSYGRPPLQEVMERMGLAKATASRRIRAAKDVGLLPESVTAPEAMERLREVMSDSELIELEARYT